MKVANGRQAVHAASAYSHDVGEDCRDVLQGKAAVAIERGGVSWCKDCCGAVRALDKGGLRHAVGLDVDASAMMAGENVCTGV